MLAVGLVDLGGEGGLVFVEGDDRWEGLAEEEIHFFQRNFESQKLCDYFHLVGGGNEGVRSMFHHGCTASFVEGDGQNGGGVEDNPIHGMTRLR